MSEALKQTRIDETVGMNIDGQFRTFAEIKTLVRAALSRSAPDRELREAAKKALIPLAALLVSGECVQERTALSSEVKAAVIEAHGALLSALAESPSESAPAPEGGDELRCPHCNSPARKVEWCHGYRMPHICPTDHIDHQRPDLYCSVCGGLLIDINEDDESEDHTPIMQCCNEFNHKRERAKLPAPEGDKHDLRNCPAMRALQSLTPLGSEYVDDIERCVEAVKSTRTSLMKALVNAKKAAPEGMGRDATLSELVGQFEDAAHEIFGNAAQFLEKNIANADFVEYKRGDVNASWIFFKAGYESHKILAHPTSEGIKGYEH